MSIGRICMSIDHVYSSINHEAGSIDHICSSISQSFNSIGQSTKFTIRKSQNRLQAQLLTNPCLKYKIAEHSISTIIKE